jgi:hypothetical protein
LRSRRSDPGQSRIEPDQGDILHELLEIAETPRDGG